MSIIVEYFSDKRPPCFHSWRQKEKWAGYLWLRWWNA